MTPRHAGAVPVAGFYFLYFATVGVTLPFLPAYLKTLGLSATQVGVILALNPTVALFAPLFWGHLADRWGRPDRVLTLIAGGAAVCFAPLLAVSGFAAVALLYAAYAFFASAITPIIDAIALNRVTAVGGAFARLRLVGSIGFVAASAAVGLSGRVDRTVVVVALGLIATYFLWSWTLRSSTQAATGQDRWAGLRLLREPDLRVFLAACALHWIACAPYHGMFAIHVTELRLPPRVIGASVSLAVVVEVLAMFVYPRLRKVTARQVLAVAFAGSAVRWAGMALATNAAAIIGLSLLHGLTFGAFYVAAIAFVAARVPADLRAQGQALFSTFTFGLGGLLGYLSSGAAYDWMGGHRLFAAAAAVDLAALVLILVIREPSTAATAQRGPVPTPAEPA